MTDWTNDARDALADWLRAVREDLENDPDVAAGDRDEIVDDLRRHVETDLEASGVSIVTAEDVRRVTGRAGRPEPAGDVAPLKPLLAKDEKADSKGPSVFVSVVFGVLLPTIALAVEAGFGNWAQIAFDPIPTVFHVVAIALVPIASVMFLNRRVDRPAGVGLVVVNAAAMGVALVYAVRTAPFVGIGIVGIIAFGLGMVALAPLFAVYAIARQREELRKGPFRKTGVLVLAATALLLGADVLNRSRCRELAHVALNKDRIAAEAAREELRKPWSTLVKASRGRHGGGGGLFGGRSNYVSPWDAARLAWVVEGTPPPDDLFSGFDGPGFTDIPGVVRYASSARLDVVAHDVDVDSDRATAYLESTLLFGNSGPWDVECACVIVLPEGGVVARASLWNRDVEVAAAFAPVVVAREAYESVVRQKRDPILITQYGPDRVLLRCFPVPSKGSMRVRIGVVAPIVPTAPDAGTLDLPVVSAANFAGFIASGTVNVRMRGDGALVAPDGSTSANGALTARRKDDRESFRLTLRRSAPFPESEEVDDLGEGAFVVRQTLRSRRTSSIKRVVFALDGAASLEGRREIVTKAIEETAAEREIALVVSDMDGVRTAVPPQLATPESKALAIDVVRRLRARGDRDDVPLLEAALTHAEGDRSNAVVWFRGFQPHVDSTADTLVLRASRTSIAPAVFDACYMGVDAPYDALSARLGEARTFKTFRAGLADIERTLARAVDGVWAHAFVRTRVAAEAGASRPSTPKDGGSRLARLYARDRCERLSWDGEPGWRREAEALSMRYGIVTDAAGAAALETEGEMARAGLHAPAPSATPRIPTTDVPEPEVYALLIVAVFVIGVAYARRGGLATP